MSGLERWRGRVAFVTGASSGVGAAVCRELATNGLRVAAVARRHVDAQLSLQCDLRDEKQIVAAFERVRATWQGVDVLINAAGIGYQSALADGNAAHWRDTLEVNVIAPSITAREAIADMRRQKFDGQIINISSMAGHRLHREDGMYPASKFALRAATETLRRELRRASSKIRISAISPGLIETEFHAHYLGSRERAAEVYASITPLRPADVASAVLYILSQPAHVDVNDVWLRPTEQEP